MEERKENWKLMEKNRFGRLNFNADVSMENKEMAPKGAKTSGRNLPEWSGVLFSSSKIT